MTSRLDMPDDIRIKVLNGNINDELQRSVATVMSWLSSTWPTAASRIPDKAIITFPDIQSMLHFDPKLCSEALDTITKARDARQDKIRNSLKRIGTGIIPPEARHSFQAQEWNTWVQQAVIEYHILNHLVEELEGTCALVNFTETMLDEECAFEKGYPLDLRDVLRVVEEQRRHWLPASRAEWPANNACSARKDSAMCCSVCWGIDCKCASNNA